MCGFVAILNICDGMSAKMREKALLMSSKIRHRGPDWSGVYSSKRCVLAHERLAIVDPLSGGQPLYTKDKKVALAVTAKFTIINRYANVSKANTSFKPDLTAR